MSDWPEAPDPAAVILLDLLADLRALAEKAEAQLEAGSDEWD